MRGHYKFPECQARNTIRGVECLAGSFGGSAQMLKADGGQETLRIHFPDAPANAADATARSALTFHFIAR